MGNMVTLSVTATTSRTEFAYFRLSATSQKARNTMWEGHQ